MERTIDLAARILDGKLISAEMRAEIQAEVTKLSEAGTTPGLGVILVGNNPASRSYVTAKEKACEQVGIYSKEIRLEATCTQQELLDQIEEMNQDETIHGILVQLPLPKHIDESAIIMAIDPSKDVDGFHPVNVGKMVIGEKAFLPCTPHGVLHMLMRSGVETKGAHIVVIGRSNIVGKPLANLLLQKREGANATVTLCHTATQEIEKHTKQADIVIAASGWPNTVTADMIKPGAVIIDVGVNRVEDTTRERGYRLVGDVDYEACAEVASVITPVPGGVGPMTITMLLFNTLEAATHFHTCRERV